MPLRTWSAGPLASNKHRFPCLKISVSLLSSIFSRGLGISCRRFLSGDGITTADFTISALAGVFESIAIDAISARRANPALGETFGTAKNLDEYQYRICILLPTVADSNPSKIRLQKYRVGIIASFAKLAAALKSGSAAEWNRNAKELLVEASDAYVAATSGRKMPDPKIGAAMAFFGAPEENVERALRSMYGYEE